jgi:hypothetical protein
MSKEKLLLVSESVAMALVFLVSVYVIHNLIN